MKRVTTILALCLLLCPLAILNGCGQQKKSVKLQFKFDEGLTSIEDWTSKRQWKKWVNDSLVAEGTQDLEYVNHRLVKRVLPDGTSEHLLSLAWTKRSRIRKETIEVDTTRDSTSYSIMALPNGRIVDVELPPEKGRHNESYWKSYYEQSSPVMPSETISQGHTWSQITKVLLDDEEVEAVVNYELKGFASEKGYDCVMIEHSGNIIIPVGVDEGDATERHGVDKIETSGLFYFAYLEGVIISSRERWLMKSEREALNEGVLEKQYMEMESVVGYTLRELVRP
ncbi:MAG: hypothetical protein V3T31_10390 [candidate division Zixibacteria bacterium]